MPDVVDEGTELAWVLNDVQNGLGRIGRDGIEQCRLRAAAPGNDPPPEVEPFARSTSRSPQTSGESKVEDQDCVSSGQSRREDVVGTQISVHDPSFAVREFSLQLDPAGGRCWRQIDRPEQEIELDHRRTEQFAELPGSGGFPSATSAQYNDSLHQASMPFALVDSASRDRR